MSSSRSARARAAAHIAPARRGHAAPRRARATPRRHRRAGRGGRSRVEQLAGPARVGRYHGQPGGQRLRYHDAVGLSLGTVEEAGSFGQGVLGSRDAPRERHPAASGPPPQRAGAGPRGAVHQRPRPVRRPPAGGAPAAAWRRARQRRGRRQGASSAQSRRATAPRVRSGAGCGRKRPRSTPGRTTRMRATDCSRTVQVKCHTGGRDDHEVRSCRARADGKPDQRAGQQVVVLEDEPWAHGAGREYGASSEPHAHPPSEQGRGPQRRYQRAQLRGLAGYAAGGLEALHRAAPQLEAALAELEHPEAATAGVVGQGAGRTRKERRILHSGGDLDQQPLGAAEDPGVADCKGRHVPPGGAECQRRRRTHCPGRDEPGPDSEHEQGGQPGHGKARITRLRRRRRDVAGRFRRGLRRGCGLDGFRGCRSCSSTCGCSCARGSCCGSSGPNGSEYCSSPALWAKAALGSASAVSSIRKAAARRMGGEPSTRLRGCHGYWCT